MYALEEYTAIKHVVFELTGRCPEGVVRRGVNPRGRMTSDADIHLEGVTKRFGDDDGGRRPDALDPARRVLRAARPVGLRQDDDAADDRRLRGPDRGPRLPRRRRRHAAPALQARRQHGLPVLRAVPAPVGRAQRRVRARAQEDRQVRGAARASARRSRWSSSASSASASRRSSPAASSSASRSPARSSTARGRCCSTSRSARSTCACASSSRSSSSGSSRRSASRSCT